MGKQSVRVYVALLRAVNVGGRGALRMADLTRIAAEIGFREPQTYIASGNLVFAYEGGEQDAKSKLKRALAAHFGKEMGVLMRTSAELSAVLAGNPFDAEAQNHTVVIFLDTPPTTAALAGVVAPGGEEVRLGRRELYVHYPNGMGRSRLRIPAAKSGTARNLNTVSKLVELCASRQK